MVIIEQRIHDIYKAIDQFEKETGILVSNIEQKHGISGGQSYVYDRKMTFSYIHHNPLPKE